MRFLRTNTAVIVTVGPFLDKTDGVTLKTALTITNERITLTADTDAGSAPTNILDNIAGATSGTANDLNYITGNDAAMMQLEFAAADVNRLGRMFLSITDAANHCPVFHEFMVLPAMVYDALVLGTAVLQADMTQLLGSAVATPTVAGVPEVDVTHWLGAGAPAAPATQASVDAADNFIDTEIADIQARLPAALVGGRIAANAEVVGDKTGYALTVTPPTAIENADALLKRDWTSVTGEAARSVLNALRILRNKWSISATTLTVTKEDDSTTAFTSALTTAAGADSITASDPS